MRKPDWGGKNNKLFYYNLLVTGVVIAVLLTTVIYYVSRVRQELWLNSVNSVLEITIQGRNNLQKQLEGDFEKNASIARLAAFGSAGSNEAAAGYLSKLINEDGLYYFVPGGSQSKNIDLEAVRPLQQKRGGKQGIIEPHFNSQTGRRVFDIFTEASLNDGTVFYLLKEYRVSKTVEEFIMTFYEKQGFSYIVASSGDIVLRPVHPNSNKTVQNVFDTIDADEDGQVIAGLREALFKQKTGWAEAAYKGRKNLICYAPLENAPGWNMVTIIPSDVVNKQAEQIISKTIVLLTVFCVSIVVLLGCYFLAYRKYTWMMHERRYRDFWFDMLSQNIESCFLIYDPVTKTVDYVFENISRILGISREAVSVDLNVLTETAADGSLKEVLRQIQENQLGGNYNGSFSYYNAVTGDVRQCKIRIYPVEDEHLGYKYIICIEDDTDELRIRKMLEESLTTAEASNRAKREFLSTMSHDIRTPINGIVGMLDIANANLDNREKLCDSLKKIKLASGHLLELINKVLEMSRIENGSLVLTEERLDIERLLREVTEIIKPAVQQKKHQLQLCIGELKHRSVYGDRLRLQQVFINLLSNAVKYTPAGGTIKVLLREEPVRVSGYACYTFSVSDNGIGMSEEFQKKLFTAFSRADDSRINKIQGSGLGMTIVQNIILLMLGEIKVESAIDQGSTFTVTFNLKLDNAGSAEEEEQEPQDEIAEPLLGKRVLLVEDNELNMEISVEMLKMLGAEVLSAWNGEEAVAIVKESQPWSIDLVLMDIMMPGMNGYEATAVIRGLGREDVKQLPIIALSANAYSEDILAAKRAGMNDHIAKPIEFVRLKKALQKLL